MTGIHMTAKKRATASPAGAIDTSAMTADTTAPSGTAFAQATFFADGGISLSATGTPASPRWWTNSSPPATWLSFTSTGTGTIINGLSAGTRYSVPTLILGISRAVSGESSRIFTISFWDASSGGNLLGSKTFTATAIRA